MKNDRRLIEDYLPIKAISAEASREKSVRPGHISTLHIWWARRPLVACRAAVYGALVSMSRFVPENGPGDKMWSLGRANAARFIQKLCKYPGNNNVFIEARTHVHEAHKYRHRKEASPSARPRVLDLFSGGGAIALEVSRLGGEAFALELNPVAYLINLCTLVYPQNYGRAERDFVGMARDKTWAGLVEEVRYWGEWVLSKVKEEIADLYPPMEDPCCYNSDAESSLQLCGEAPTIASGVSGHAIITLCGH